MSLLGVRLSARQAILAVLGTLVALVAIWYGLVVYLVAFGS